MTEAQTQKQKTEHTIDASDRSVGRVATETAKILMGKDDPSFVRNKPAAVTVHITNASKARIPASKRSQKIYKQYSGHPGGLKETSMEELIEKKGYAEVFRNAVYGMLPANKLRKVMLKNLTVSE